MVITSLLVVLYTQVNGGWIYGPIWHETENPEYEILIVEYWYEAINHDTKELGEHQGHIPPIKEICHVVSPPPLHVGVVTFLQWALTELVSKAK